MTVPSSGTPASRATRRVLAVVPDLFFAGKIVATGAACGVSVELVPPESAAARCAELKPALVLLDLHTPGAVPELAVALKSAAGSTPVIGFYAHIDHALRLAALATRLDAVLPRSAFVTRLSELLDGSDRALAGPKQP